MRPHEVCLGATFRSAKHFAYLPKLPHVNSGKMIRSRRVIFVHFFAQGPMNTIHLPKIVVGY